MSSSIIYSIIHIYIFNIFHSSQVVGMIVSLEKHMQEYEKQGQDQVVRILQNVRKHCLEIFERFIVSITNNTYFCTYIQVKFREYPR